jgi:hypothetical protein
MKHFIGIDAGTGSARAGPFGSAGVRLDRALRARAALAAALRITVRLCGT